MVWRQTLIFCTFFISFVKIQQVVCSGVFELRLKSFINENGKDSLGHCCSGERTGARCAGTCRTRFRVCLKHFQQSIDSSTDCTFGEKFTPVLGDNNVHLADAGTTIPGFVNPIRFPFEFTWPGTFSLIVEAWHDTTSGNTSADDAGVLWKASDYARKGVLISRMSDTKYLDVNLPWSPMKFESSNSSIAFDFRVTCDTHYYGAGCAKFCRPKDDFFGHHTCSASGEIQCLPGWQNETCYCCKPTCSPGCDDIHGYCNKPAECLCHVGWHGKNCSECELYPGCIRGTCTKPWECSCDEGWGGLFCNQDLNYCTNHKPCRNGGTCFNSGEGLYTCSCPPGYEGTDCDVRLSNCSSTPCLNGAACKQNGSNYQCECSKGWYGTHCEIPAQTCEVKPCKHGGVCRDTIHGYKCSCPLGYGGAECQSLVNHCMPNPCSNGGNCTLTSTSEGYKCTCASGFTGRNCATNVDDCKGKPCGNGGTCVDLVNGYKCHCVLGYAGEHCQLEVDYCKMTPCANGGMCEALLNDYRCKCKPGFGGKDCSVEVEDECVSKPCQNGGTCYPAKKGGYECTCVSGYSGQNCENDNSSMNAIVFGDRHMAVASVAAAAADDADAEKLSLGRWYVIGVVSVSVPVLVLIAVLVVHRMKQRRKRDQRKADDEARMQNEQNSVHSSVTMTKRGETHMIKNTWGQCVKNVDVDNVAGDLCYPKQVYAPVPSADPNIAPAYTLQRSRSQKQLNIDPPMHRHSICNRVSCKDLDNIVRSSTPASLDNRLSVLSINISHSNLSDSSLNKQHSSQLLLEKDNKSVHNNTLNSSVLNSSIGGGSNGGGGGGNGSSVYVIDEHFTQTLFATEV